MVSQPPMAYEVIAAGDTKVIGLVLKGSEIQAKANSQRPSDAAAPFALFRLVSRPGVGQKLRGEAALVNETRWTERLHRP